MISSFGEPFPVATDRTRGGNTTTIVRRDVRASFSSSRDRTPLPPPPSHPTATREVGKLLDLGLALGYQRFELVSLAERDDAGMVAAHAWAETRRDGDDELEYPPTNNRAHQEQQPSLTACRRSPAVSTRSRPRPCSHNSDSIPIWGRDDNILREVRRGADSILGVLQLFYLYLLLL